VILRAILVRVVAVNAVIPAVATNVGPEQVVWAGVR